MNQVFIFTRPILSILQPNSFHNRSNPILMVTDFVAEIRKKEVIKCEILPAKHHRSVKVCSILPVVLDSTHRDLGLSKGPRVPYHGLADTVAADTSFKEIRKEISGRRTDISHLKAKIGRLWLLMTPQHEHSDMGIATALAHEVGHPVDRHCVEVSISLSKHLNKLSTSLVM